MITLIIVLFILVALVIYSILFYFKKKDKLKKIEILEAAKQHYIDLTKDDTIDLVGMCSSIYDVMVKKYNEKVESLKMPKYIPEMNRNNMIRLAKIYKFNEPYEKYFWWDVNDKETRLKAFDALIDSIKNDI